MFWNCKLYKKVIIFVIQLVIVACNENVNSVDVDDDFELSASLETRADGLQLSDFSDVYLFYPTQKGVPEYDSVDISKFIEFSGQNIYFRGALHDFFWSDVKDASTSQFYIVGKYLGDEVWANAVEGNKELRSGIYRHKRLEFNSLEYRYSRFTIIVEGKNETDSLDGNSLKLRLKTYKPIPTNSFLKRQVACSQTQTQTMNAEFTKYDHSFCYTFRNIPEQTIDDANKYLEVRYAGIDYIVDLSKLHVSRSASNDTVFRYIAGENQTLTVKIQPSVALSTSITVNSDSWNSMESLGNYVGDLKE